ncbi:carboxypeptidase family protein [Luteibacter rhizovicinus]|uniref:Carboxypeptidase family protein n=1 Tax=Luteibacter rhizovicinus TaxID=242606 RepID=A0A4R3YRB8_9GAMM|nr:carboxypeptidase regulatory-like domain-containing protein [Luteibacter rhizovicinus]TCV94912.1 carboxypeptidase family protein [Luteibacter rhizovicinus]
MNSRIRAKLLPLAIASLLAAAPAFAQDTSSAIAGRVVDASGKPVANATVRVVHEPSGTTKVVTTDADGRYAAQGLRVGGPFDVTATNASGQSVAEQHDVYLQLAQTSSINLSAATAASASAQALEGVTVSASTLGQTFTPENKGISTNISRREIEAQPTPGRSIQNIVRMDPRIVISDRDRGEISAVGQNSRYNNITVDSVSANDPFGLNANGLPTLGTPISQDTIEEYNISTANYDVATRRGVGAIVNAVTKSGTNEFHGSTYYAFQNRDDMIADYNNQSYGGFRRQWTAGATLGGPIIKDKLFFFASYEKSKQIGPSSQYGVQGSGAATEVKGLKQSDVDQITNIAKGMGLDPGSTSGGNSDLQDKRYLAKIDWNITDNHRASFTYNQTKENKPIITGTNTTLVLSSGWYKTNVDNKGYALHFYDDWSDVFSTDTTISYSDFNQVRGPYNGVNAPDITVRPTGQGSSTSQPGVEFGTEYSSQANILRVKTFNAAWAGTLYLGDHTLKGGADFERGNYYNLFLQNAFGSYIFNSIADFQKAATSPTGTYFQYRYNAPAPGFGLNDVAANFQMKNYGIFLQDTWAVTPNLSVQYGFRVDIPRTSDKPTYNSCFNAAPGVAFADPSINCAVSGGYGQGGFGQTNQYTINGNRQVQPRMSFNYNFNTERMMQLRGGAGLFIASPPSVWLGNIYQNTGVQQVQYNCGTTQTSCNTLAQLPAFSADPNNQNAPGRNPVLGQNGATMTVNTVSQNIQLPSVWKMSIGLDKELPWWGLIFTADYEHLKNRNAIFYTDLNIGTPTGTLPDGRNVYLKTWNASPNATGNTARANSNKSFSDAVINLGNSSRGSADSLALSLKKTFNQDLFGMIGFTWSRSTELNPGTSSVARSNFSNNVWVNPNTENAETSNYSVPKRVIASLTWQHRFFGDYATSASMFYDGHSGAPYSWRFGNDANGDGFVSDLAYIPKRGEVAFTANTPQSVRDSFFNYIENNSYLNDHSGSVARRNGARSPWINQIDLSFRQEIPGLFKGNKGEIRFDIYNVGNMIKKSWGVDHRASFPLVRNLADVAGVNAQGQYIYDLSKSTYQDGNGNYKPLDLPRADELNGPTQRWSVLATLKYTF